MNPTSTVNGVALVIRQTHLRALEEQCPAMAYALAIEHREGPSYRGALRGTVIHTVFSRYVEWLYETGRETGFDTVGEIARQAIAEVGTLTYPERLDVLEQAENIGRGYLFVRDHYYGAEEALSCDLDLGDGRSVTITGRLDLLEVGEGRAVITDCKSNHSLPADAAVQTDFQLMTYALLVMENLPVDVVQGQLWFTRYNKRVPQHGEALWTREDIDGFREHLVTTLRAFLELDRTLEYVPGTWCQYCPRKRPGDCTLWQRHSVIPALRTPRQARTAAARAVALEQQLDALKAGLKEYTKANGNVRIGSTHKAETYGYRLTESETFTPSGVMELLESVEAQALFSETGQPSLDELLSVNRSATPFKRLRRDKALREHFDEIAGSAASTRFGHWSGDE